MVLPNLVNGTYGLMSHWKERAVTVKYIAQGQSCAMTGTQPHTLHPTKFIVQRCCPNAIKYIN